MFCNQCGNKVSEGAVFCDSCGARVDAAPVSAAPVSAPPKTSTSSTAFKASFPTDGSKKSILFYAMLTSATIAILLLFFQEWISMSAEYYGTRKSIAFVLTDSRITDSDAGFWAVMAILTTLAAVGAHVLCVLELIFKRKIINIKNIKTVYISAAATTLTFIFVVFACLALKGEAGNYSQIKIAPTFWGYFTMILTAGNVFCDFLYSKED